MRLLWEGVGQIGAIRTAAGTTITGLLDARVHFEFWQAWSDPFSIRSPQENGRSRVSRSCAEAIDVFYAGPDRLGAMDDPRRKSGGA